MKKYQDTLFDRTMCVDDAFKVGLTSEDHLLVEKRISPARFRIIGNNLCSTVTIDENVDQIWNGWRRGVGIWSVLVMLISQ